MTDRITYCFANYRLDAYARVLYRGEELVRVEPKLVDLLLYLIERRGLIVSKDELMQGVWPGVVVEDGAVRRSISLLRRALDENDSELYIETLLRVGYRLRASVTIQDDGQDGGALQPSAIPLLTTPSLSTASEVTKKSISKSISRSGLILLSIVIVAGAVGMRFLGQRYASTPQYVLKQLTTNSAELPIIAATISPNGSMIVFADETQLFVSDATVAERHPLPLPKDVIPSYIVWFPDGVHLLISGINSRTHESEVWSQSALGGEPELRIRDARMAAPSPDARQIVFVRNENQLWLIDSTGLNAKMIASAPGKDTYGLHPQFSNDGQSIIFCRSGTGEYQTTIESRNIVSGAVTALYTTSDFVFDFLLTANDQLLIAKRNQVSDTVESEIISVDLNARSLGMPPHKSLEVWPGYITTTISASRNGRDVLVMNSKSTSGIFVADLSEDGNRIKNTRRLILNESPHRPAGWLNDSKTILFYADREGHYDIYKQAIDDVSAQVLAHDEHDKYFPAISADQRFLFYFVNDEHKLRLNSPVTMMRVALNDGTKTVIDTQLDSYRLLRCDRQKNRCILAEHAAEHAMFYAFDPILGKGNELAKIKWVPGATFCDWDISPDGNYIAFIDTVNDPDVIGVIDLRTSPAYISRVHVTGQDPLRTISWDAQGSGYYASTYNNEGDILRLLHVSSNGEAHVLDQELNSVDGRMYVSPDGRHLAFHKFVANPNIWLLHAQ